MDSDSFLSSIALAISLVFFALATVGEAAVSSTRRDRALRLVSEDVTGAANLNKLYSLPMGPVGALTLLSVFALSASLLSVGALVIAQTGTRWAVISLATLGALTLLGLIRILALSIASHVGEKIALNIASTVRGLAWLLNPVLALEAGILRRTGGEQFDLDDEDRELVSTEIDLPLESVGEPLDEREVRMIRAIVQQDKTVAREIMVPRVDIAAAEISASVAELTELMQERAHSRIPVYRDNLDHIEGIAHVRDILSLLSRGGDALETSLEDVIRPPLFIPESKTLEELLNEFQQRHVHMAIVVDEYGGVSGLVTIEDLLEEIVGEIQDEFDIGESEIENVRDGEFVMDARVGIDQLNELLSVSVESEGFDTLGGFVYQQLGKIPSPGDSVEYDGIKVEVISTVGRRLKRLRVTKATEHDIGARN